MKEDSNCDSIVNHVTAIIPAAGVGVRFSSVHDIHPQPVRVPKQYQLLQGKFVLTHILEQFTDTPWIRNIIVATHEGDTNFSTVQSAMRSPKLKSVQGGEIRARSVFNALEAMSDQLAPQDWVLVHDAVRPCLTRRDLENLRKEVIAHDVGGILAEKINATVKESGVNQHIHKTINREKLWLALTPQMFRFEILYTSLKYCLDKGYDITDEAQAVEYLGFSPILVPAQDSNIKITTPNDLHIAELLLNTRQEIYT